MAFMYFGINLCIQLDDSYDASAGSARRPRAECWSTHNSISVRRRAPADQGGD